METGIYLHHRNVQSLKYSMGALIGNFGNFSNNSELNSNIETELNVLNLEELWRGSFILLMIGFFSNIVCLVLEILFLYISYSLKIIREYIYN